ncbi:MAG: T9SS type A sorting domain-containing protein [Calditrichaeota bacterium]|nr:T9SS type A sorting domain-containing protein [Calditrichota bacterium]
MKKATVFAALILLLFAAQLVQAQPEPVSIVTPVLVDSAVYNGIYRGVQMQIFCEPTTGNLVTAWYRYYSSGPDPRRITAATSIDGGQTWTVHEKINFGVGDEMNARYASVYGTPTTPIIVYADRNPGGSDRDSRPVVAMDIAGWGGGAFINYFVDDSGTPDTVLYSRYNSVAVAPDNDQLWAVGSYHTSSKAPGEGLYYYVSKDGGITWSRPKVVASIAKSDSGKPNYVIDLSSSGLGVGLGPNNAAFVSGLGQWYSDDDLWRLLYAKSDDAGMTWSPISIIPGAETLQFANADVYKNFTAPFVDKDGNWHIFALGTDTMDYVYPDFPEPYRGFDFRFDGSTWSINKFAFPSFLDNGLAALGDFSPDQELFLFNDPAVGPDGTLYYAYSDVVDTTGAMGDPYAFNYNIMIMYSEDNGDTWHGPVSVLDKWTGHAPCGMARFATDKLHIVYRRHFNTSQADQFYYIGVPTDTIKARATGVNDQVTQILPTEFELHQNYPNPFNPTTNITFDLTQPAKVTLKIYNDLGQEVATLIDQKQMDAGFKGITWHASDLPSGVYIYKLTAGSFTATKKMILTK